MPNLHIYGLAKNDAKKVFRQIRDIFGENEDFKHDMIVTIHHSTTVFDLQSTPQPYIKISSTLEKGDTEESRFAKISRIKELLFENEIGLDIEIETLHSFDEASPASKKSQHFSGT